MPTPSYKRLVPLFSAVGQMFQLAWQAGSTAVLLLLLLQLLQGILPVVTAWIMKAILDELTFDFVEATPPDFYGTFLPLLIIQSVILIAGQTVAPVNEFVTAELGRTLKLKTQSIIYTKITNFEGVGYFEDPQFHDTIRLATQGVQTGPMRIISFSANIMRNLLLLFSFLSVLWIASPTLTALVLLTILPQFIVRLRFAQQHIDVMIANSPKERQAFYLEQLLSSIRFVKEIQLFNLGNYILNRFLGTTREIHGRQTAQAKQETVRQVQLNAFLGLTTSIGFIFVIFQAASRQITLGDVTLYTAALISVQTALSEIVSTVTLLGEDALFFTHFTDLLALPANLPTKKPKQKISPLCSAIEFRNVSFRYSPQHPWVLQNVNLILQQAQCLALVGLNGSGKTTLVKLLTRLYDPTEGQILWDGVDIRHYNTVDLRKRIGAIFQDFAQYDLTVEENIGFGDINSLKDRERIQQAALAVDIHEWLQTLPHGYQTVLSRWLAEGSDTGMDLSRGQWQKIAMARMLMRDADLLILDEPTAALDAQAEHMLFNKFISLTQAKTCLLISHRFSTVKMADRIVVLENGKVIEQGSHEQLMTLGHRYATLYKMQAEKYQ